MSQPTPSTPTPKTSNATRKPRVSIAIATAFGLGYLPKAPGTWGSLGGVALAAIYWWIILPGKLFERLPLSIPSSVVPILLAITVTIMIAVLGVVAATSAAIYIGKKDPQVVVIDEVSGQLISYFGIGAAMPNWKYLLLGFILFRVFDIWKPFPARQAESLPGGLGIMADDWIAGIYAALGLWAARAAGL